MKRIATLAAASAVALGAAAAGSAATHELVASVSDPLNISLKAGGRPVTHLKAGTYTIVVEDRSAVHNFHLRGPGVDKLTSVVGKGTQRWTVKLVPGRYTYVCDPHKSFMRGSFTVS